ncbi:hypothetical protein J6590_060336 [Homalodisca vitripennis]|nr:hypothetical protein J6590_060336 [Homalodisca vitripennis]
MKCIKMREKYLPRSEKYFVVIARKKGSVVITVTTRFYCSAAVVTRVTARSKQAVTYVHLKSPDEVMTGAQQHDYNTPCCKLPSSTHRLAPMEKKPTYVGAKLWNALPLELKRRTGCSLDTN